ncbi:DUF4153 domain-containing protein [Nocardia inohanensis]|uniref:DUF4153 domain-containing protein n=1 Tax=Nocardia inohanensis TaxID=209246 RepID=UPI000A5616AB|nr:DUF4173 domain-containing protein [Nocardia inohanensis]
MPETPEPVADPTPSPHDDGPPQPAAAPETSIASAPNPVVAVGAGESVGSQAARSVKSGSSASVPPTSSSFDTGMHVAGGELPPAPGPHGVAALSWPSAAPGRVVPRSMRIPMPRGTLPAIGVAGVAAAVCVPFQGPGIGWLLAGSVAAAAVYVVDRAARRSADGVRPDSSVPAAADDGAAAADDGAAAADDGAAAADRGAAAADRGAAGADGDAVVADGDAVVAQAGAVGTLETGVAASGRSIAWGRVWWTGLALVLLAVGVFRDAPWLFLVCVLGAGAAGSLAVLGRRSVYGIVFEVLAVPISASLALPWVARGIGRVRWRRGQVSAEGAARMWWSVLATAGLLIVVVPLLAAADAVFAELVSGLIPQWDAAPVARWVCVFVLGALGAAGALYLLAGPPPAARPEGSGRTVSRWEWVLPVGALSVVFAVFVATQVVVLFGGDGYVQRTAGLTYAEYARSGFGQLSLVTVLTLIVIAAVSRWAARESVADRMWLRSLLGVVSALSLVMVASAAHRMWTYQQAYGFTVPRLTVIVFETWIGVVYLLVLAGLVALRPGWVSRAAVGTALSMLVGLAALNPERFIADRNIDRWETGKTIDGFYLSQLSADALPALDRLPEPMRTDIAETIRKRLGQDTWQSFNLSRRAARN